MGSIRAAFKQLITESIDPNYYEAYQTSGDVVTTSALGNSAGGKSIVLFQGGSQVASKISGVECDSY